MGHLFLRISDNPVNEFESISLRDFKTREKAVAISKTRICNEKLTVDIMFMY